MEAGERERFSPAGSGRLIFFATLAEFLCALCGLEL
jgi:hypothetical protein